MWRLLWDEFICLVIPPPYSTLEILKYNNRKLVYSYREILKFRLQKNLENLILESLLSVRNVFYISLPLSE